jgi:hypothetical protein
MHSPKRKRDPREPRQVPETHAELEIVVDARHIRLGKRNDSFKCPIALALDEQGFDGVSVGPRAFRVVNREGYKVHYHLPAPAAEFMAAFEAGAKNLDPFSFVAQVMDEDLLKTFHSQEIYYVTLPIESESSPPAAGREPRPPGPHSR